MVDDANSKAKYIGIWDLLQLIPTQPDLLQRARTTSVLNSPHIGLFEKNKKGKKAQDKSFFTVELQIGTGDDSVVGGRVVDVAQLFAGPRDVRVADRGRFAAALGRGFVRATRSDRSRLRSISQRIRRDNPESRFGYLDIWRRSCEGLSSQRYASHNF